MLLFMKVLFTQFIAEMGDKTQLMLVAMTSKFKLKDILLLINLLGAYVHTCRLQYVEFFGKFFEGGGKEFHPFRENTKYVDIKED